MAKQKMVVKLSLDDAKKRAKALKAAVTMNGILSVALDGDKLVVIGDGTDVVSLTTLLRRKLGYADLISVVTSGDEKKENKGYANKQGESASNIQPTIYPYQYSYEFPYVYHDGSYDQFSYR